MRWGCHHLFRSYDRNLSNIANIRLHSVSGHTIFCKDNKILEITRWFRLKIVTLHPTKRKQRHYEHEEYPFGLFSTKRIVREIASQFQKPVIEYDITSDVLKDDVSLGSDGDLLIVGVPSYAGRVPEMAVRSLRRFLGNNTPAIIVSAYGNRAYDDTLIELKDLMESHGFKLLSAAAVIAQHSI